MRVHTSHIVVEKEKWWEWKGEVGLAKDELVRLDGHGGLINKCNDFLERDCEYIKSTTKKLRMKYKDEDKDHHPPVFRAVRTRRVVVNDFAVIQSVLKDVRVQGMWNTCFMELYCHMFHLSKHRTRETTWTALPCQNVTFTTDVESIDTMALTDYRVSMVLCR